jgi:hypothetical protein
MKQIQRGLQHIHRERRAGSLPETHVEIEDRSYSQPLERQSVTPFGGSMAEKQIFE